MEIKKDLLDYLAEKTGVAQKDLLEKDMRLHLLLKELCADEDFREEYAFKGGTCLIKCYLGYYRFSEDLDFSWKNQERFAGKTEKQIRRELSGEIDKLAALIEKACKKQGLDYKPDKKDKRFFEYGASNKQVTCKAWYKSVELKRDQYIKIQVNYVEKFHYPFIKTTAGSLLKDVNAKELAFLYPETDGSITEPIEIDAYDPKEILIEKIRAILTRKGTKARDYIDAYLIEKYAKTTAESLKRQIKAKTNDALKREKYEKNFTARKQQKPEYAIGDEQKLLLKPLDEGFKQYVKELDKLLSQLIETIEKDIKRDR
jgi:predicted nucleotidyltransferase component of viral defense system